MTHSTLFDSWWQGGFEASTMLFSHRPRVDVTAATHHDVRAAQDYALLRAHGIRTLRDGLRWPAMEPAPGVYDLDAWTGMLRAAERSSVQVIWDLLHFGYPDHLDPWSEAFVAAFAAFSHAAATRFRETSDAVPWWAPVNEISYWSFGGGQHAHFAPFGLARGEEWKAQLVRCSLAAMASCRAVDPRARFLHTDPVIHTVDDSGSRTQAARAEADRQSMFEAWDMIGGLARPELGGWPEALDVVGVNFYGNNEKFVDGRPVPMGDIFYRPLHQILIEVWERYRRPILLSEIGAEAGNGPGWLRYVSGEARIAAEQGVPIEGLCLYPIMDYPGWTDDRHCPIGLIRLDDQLQARSIEPLLAAELEREQRMADLLAADRAANENTDGPPGGWRRAS